MVSRQLQDEPAVATAISVLCGHDAVQATTVLLGCVRLSTLQACAANGFTAVMTSAGKVMYTR